MEENKEIKSPFPPQRDKQPEKAEDEKQKQKPARDKNS